MSILEQLKRLSSAEDFFSVLDVPYDKRIVNVARLHILKRMGQSLASTDFAGMSEAEVRSACAETLEQAYRDFLGSGPLDQRVFKVLRDRDPSRPATKGAFVPLTALFDDVERT
ncbi:MAG: nitrogenase stabilizing/protective protein [Rhizobiales bacterium 32-66-8]|nr:MAG: nitrogenase stabilizing/protective protein [Rhizobiales bacterium 32-66-8]